MNYKIRQLFIEEKSDAFNSFMKIRASGAGARIMADKITNIAIKINDIDNRAANILKQEMLARDGDVATSRETLHSSAQKSDIIIFGTRKNIKSLIDKISIQPFGLKSLSVELNDFLDHIENTESCEILRIKQKEFNLKNKVVIMGILNVTSDSFFDGGKYYDIKNAFKRADKIVEEGADIIDVGGMSTRPGSAPVSAEEEIERTVPIISYIKKNHDILISVDTYRSSVAIKAIEAGADIINDISGLVLDDNMAKVVSDYNSSLVLMHMKGTPQDMQKDPFYEDVIEEIYDFFQTQATLAIERGIKPGNIIIDPGLGFGKNLEHNFTIVKKLKDFKSLGFPILIGASRKSFTGALSNLPPDKRLEGSLAVEVMSVMNGANLLRVHDVEKTIRAIKLVKAIQDIK
ncbi:MAG: dihydropteroate synthase [Actinomycetota bacterium]|nr:dihydropteroate synthase [Actinomycetota bacterium]